MHDRPIPLLQFAPERLRLGRQLGRKTRKLRVLEIGQNGLTQGRRESGKELSGVNRSLWVGGSCLTLLFDALLSQNFFLNVGRERGQELCVDFGDSGLSVLGCPLSDGLKTSLFIDHFLTHVFRQSGQE
jgi:hypothetical protein